MEKRPLFGPAGNSRSFYEAKLKSTWQAPAWLEQLGLDAYEYSAGNGIKGSAETFARIGEEAKKHRIALSLHAPYYISLSSVDPEKRLKSVETICRSIEAAEAMGADRIVIHTGSASKITREQAVDYAKDTMFKALESLGNTGVRLGLETMGKINQLGTLDEVLEICKMDARLCPVIDFGHLNARNVGGLFTCADDYRRVFTRIDEVLGSAYLDGLHCHFSKIEYTSAGEKRHLTFEDTVFGPPFEPLMQVLAEDRLNPRVIVESDGTMAEDALTLKRTYEAYLGQSVEQERNG